MVADLFSIKLRQKIKPMAVTPNAAPIQGAIVAVYCPINNPLTTVPSVTPKFPLDICMLLANSLASGAADRT